MRYTANLKLRKPSYTDTADIEDLNWNMDIIDELSTNLNKGVVEWNQNIGIDILNNAKHPSPYVTDTGEAKKMGLEAQWYHIIYLPHKNKNGYGVQLALPFYGAIGDEISYRCSNANVWQKWKTIKTTDNIQYGADEPNIATLPVGGIYIKV